MAESTFDRLAYANEYRNRNKELLKEKRKAYLARPTVAQHDKEWRRLYSKRPEVKAKTRKYLSEYSKRPEVITHKKEYLKQYLAVPENKLRIKLYHKVVDAKPEARERRRLHMKVWKNRPEAKNKRKEYKHMYAKTPQEKLAKRGREYRRLFGITMDDYNKMLDKQGGVCRICKKPETMYIKGTLCRMPVDHDHSTNKVRGLLCTKCNIGLGAFFDSPNLLRKAAEYLESHS